MFGKAKKMAKRIGCEAFKVVFSISIIDILLPSNIELEDGSWLSLCFERGGKTSSTSNKILDRQNFELRQEGGIVVVVDETLELMGTLYREKDELKEKTFQKKKGKLILRQYKKNSLFGKDAYKGIGITTVELDKYANGLKGDGKGVNNKVTKKDIIHMDLFGGTTTVLLHVEVTVTSLKYYEDAEDDSMSVGSFLSDMSDVSSSGLGGGSSEQSARDSIDVPISFDFSDVYLQDHRRISQSTIQKTALKTDPNTNSYIQRYDLYKKSPLLETNDPSMAGTNDSTKQSNPSEKSSSRRHSSRSGHHRTRSSKTTSHHHETDTKKHTSHDKDDDEVELDMSDVYSESDADSDFLNSEDHNNIIAAALIPEDESQLTGTRDGGLRDVIRKKRSSTSTGKTTTTTTIHSSPPDGNVFTSPNPLSRRPSFQQAPGENVSMDKPVDGPATGGEALEEQKKPVEVKVIHKKSNKKEKPSLLNDSDAEILLLDPSLDTPIATAEMSSQPDVDPSTKAKMHHLSDSKFKLKIIQAYKDDLRFFKTELKNRNKTIQKLENELLQQTQQHNASLLQLRTELITSETLLRTEKVGHDMLLASTQGNIPFASALDAVREETKKIATDFARCNAALTAMTENLTYYEELAHEALISKKEEVMAAQEAANVAVKASLQRAELEQENEELLSELIEMKMKNANFSMELDQEQRRNFHGRKRMQVYAEKVASMEIALARLKSNMMKLEQEGHDAVDDNEAKEVIEIVDEHDNEDDGKVEDLKKNDDEDDDEEEGDDPEDLQEGNEVSNAKPVPKGGIVNGMKNWMSRRRGI